MSTKVQAELMFSQAFEKYLDLFPDLKQANFGQDAKSDSALLQTDPTHFSILWLFKYISPITDPRLSSQTFKEIDPTQPPFRTVQPPSIFFSGETTSWNFYQTQALESTYAKFQNRVAKMTLRTKSKDAATLKQKLKFLIGAKIEKVLQSYASISQKLYGKNIDLSRIFIAGSGTDAIVFLNNLFCISEAERSLTTRENGGGIESDLQNPDLISLRYGNLNQNISNKKRLQSDLVKDYLRDIDKLYGFISITKISKSGLLLSKSSLRRILEKIDRVNSKRALHQRIVVVLDIVQEFGRTRPLLNKDYFNFPSLCAVVHSGSKAVGAVSHTGFVALTSYGEKLLQAKLKWLWDQESQSLNILEQTHSSLDGRTARLIEKHQVLGLRCLFPDQKESLSSCDLTIALRAQDNIFAIKKLSEHQETLLGSALAKKIMEVYREVFKSLGWKILSNDTPSILPLELPDEFDDNQVESILAACAQKCIAFGGILKNPGSRTMIRWGLNREILTQLFDKEISMRMLREKLLTNSDSLAATLKEVMQSLTKLPC